MSEHTTSLGLLIAIVAWIGACSAAGEAPRTAAAAAPTAITLTATDYAYQAPDTIPAGFTTFNLVNNSEQFHMAQLIKLEDGKTLDDFLTAYGEAFRTKGPRPEWAKRLGGPGGAEPHGRSNATLHLEPGNYAWICLMNPPPDRVPHVMKGMARPFVVTADGATAASRTAPKSTAVIQLVDYAYGITTPLSAGRNMIRVENKGAQPHEVGLAKLAPGKTLKDFETWLNNFDGPPPATSVGGLSSLAADTDAYFEADLTPGEYVLFCLVTAPDGRPHIAHGMIQHFSIA